MSEQPQQQKQELGTGILGGIGQTLGNTASGLTNTVGGTLGAVGKGESINICCG